MSEWFRLLPDVSAQGVGYLWRATWQGSVGFLIVWLVCGLVPRMPARFQCWLWRLALLKFMVVLLWRVPLPVPLLPAVAELPAHMTTPMGAAPAVGGAIPIQSASNIGGPPAAGLLPLLLTVLFVAWLVSIGWQVGRLIRGWLAMQRFRRHCRTLTSDELTQHLRMLCKAYAVHRLPPLLEHEGAGSPLLLGILRPVIVMPSGLLSAFGSEQCRMAVAHELAHIKRHDLAWSLVAALVRMVFVFHPLVWWASRRLEVAQEIAADQFVLTSFRKDICTYAEMLLAVASQPQPNGLVPVLSAGTVGRYRTLKRRIAAMKSFHPTSRGVVVASVTLVFLGAIVGIMPWRLVAADVPASAAPQVSTSLSIAKSVTVFPIVLNSGAPIPGVSADMSKNMAELVGLFLERAGMKEIEIADAKFIPPQKADLAKAAEAFGRFVPSQELKTEYALYGQFIGTPGKGADEIRLVVVNRQGKVVLTERLDRQQLLAGGEKIADPMAVCSYAVSRLRPLWGLDDSNRKDAPEGGKMAKLWAEKSGLPSKAEREAMQSRLKTLKQTIKTSTLAVFVQVSGNSSDAKAADALAEMLTHEGLGRAEAIRAELKFTVKPNNNQLRVISDTARAFRDYLHKNPPAADYALLAEYGIGRFPDGRTAVDGIGLIVCDRNGDWVLVTGRNSHQADFQQINPHSPDDCNHLVVEVMESNLR